MFANIHTLYNVINPNFSDNLTGDGNMFDDIIFSCIKNDDCEAVRQAIESGANINVKNKYDHTPLMMAIVRNQNDWNEIAKLMIARGADVNACMEDGFSSLHLAASLDNTGIVKILINAGADINAQNSGGDTPLHTAALNNSVKSFALLLEAGAKSNIKNCNGETVYTIANNDIYRLYTEYQSKMNHINSANAQNAEKDGFVWEI